MDPELQTIRLAYESEGMTPEQIAEDRELELPAVKAALMTVSSKYRKDCGKEPEEEDNLNFSKDEARRIKEEMVSIALSAEDPNLRFRACTVIRDDFKGRRDVVKGVQGMQFNNILMINDRMRQMREVAGGMVKQVLGNSGPKKIINV